MNLYSIIGLIAAVGMAQASDTTLDLRLRVGVTPGITETTASNSSGPVIEQAIPDVSRLGFNGALTVVWAWAPEDRLGWVIGGGPFVRDHRATDFRVRTVGLNGLMGPTLSLDPDLRLELVACGDAGLSDGGAIAGYEHQPGRYLAYGGQAGLYWSAARHVIVGVEVGWQRITSVSRYEHGPVQDSFELVDRGEGGFANVAVGWRF